MTRDRLIPDNVWNNNFAVSSQAFIPLAPFCKSFQDLKAWPTLDELNQLASAYALKNYRNQDLSFVPSVKGKIRRDQDGGVFATIYELMVYKKGQVPTREGSWHDFCNFLTWCAFPRSKSAIHELGGREVEATLSPEMTKLPGNRSKLRDFLTRFDEGGSLLVVSKGHVAEVAAHLEEIGWQGTPIYEQAWKVKPYVFGHAILESFLMKRYAIGAVAFLVPVEDIFYDLDPLEQLSFTDKILADGLMERQEDAFKRCGIPMVDFESWKILS